VSRGTATSAVQLSISIAIEANPTKSQQQGLSEWLKEEDGPQRERRLGRLIIGNLAEPSKGRSEVQHLGWSDPAPQLRLGIHFSGSS